MKFVRYLIVQIAAYCLDMGSFVFLYSYFSISPLWANLYGKMLAGLFAFFAHRSFTFSVAGEGGAGRQGIRYSILLGLNIPLSALVLSVMLMAISAPFWAKFTSDVICVFVTFWLSKHFVFVSKDVLGGKVSNRGAA